LICGLILDLLASHTPFGMHALNFTLTSFFLYRIKQNFFEDSLATLSIMTFFFSVVSTGIQLIQFYLIGKGLILTFDWFVSDLIIMPAFDALYALISFTLPALFFSKPQKHGTDYFL
jgi:rod shape-determining protein MreD